MTSAARVVILRPIRASDDRAVAEVIRSVMTEFRCTGPGFAIHDPEVLGISGAYAAPDARYYVVECDGQVVGGGGFARLLGSTAADAVCELRKMYFRPVARGLGAGRALLLLLLDEMRAAGFRRCYLETTSWMDAARSLYIKAGFRERQGPAGCTGHHGCDRFFEREL